MTALCVFLAEHEGSGSGPILCLYDDIFMICWIPRETEERERGEREEREEREREISNSCFLAVTTDRAGSPDVQHRAGG